jgi:hypothetical protein
MPLTADFWNAYKGLVLVGSDGTVRFTAAGKTRLAPLLAKYGFALQNVLSTEDFCRVFGRVNAGEIEENTLAFEKVLTDPATSPAERQLIERILGRDTDSRSEAS